MIEKGFMMADLDDAVQRYGKLEIRLQKMMAARCQAHCAGCRITCCKAVFCRESVESPFLTLVRERFSARVKWDPGNGWLTPEGCGLAAGRPPVCYEFICTTILKAQWSTGHRQALGDLAMLMTQAGKKASGKSHLVELDQLERLNLRRLTIQFSQAEHALDRLVAFWEGGAI